MKMVFIDPLKIILYLRFLPVHRTTCCDETRLSGRLMAGSSSSSSASTGFCTVNVFAPIIGGVLAQRWGWRSTMWFLSAFGAVTLIFISERNHIVLRHPQR
jgi:MFS family permease